MVQIKKNSDILELSNIAEDRRLLIINKARKPRADIL